MSPPQPDSHVELYNGLLLIPDAHDYLRQERRAHLLASGSVPESDIASMSDDELMQPIWRDSEVCALLRNEEISGRFWGIWIVHRHFSLKKDERMVATQDVSEPTLYNPTHLAERWDQNGNEIEFMQPGADDAPLPTPSHYLVTTFRDLMRDRFGVSGLGLCRAARRLEPEYIYRERTEAVRRAQIVEVVRRDEVLPDESGSVYPSGWVITDPDSASCYMDCNCTCPSCKLKSRIDDLRT